MIQIAICDDAAIIVAAAKIILEKHSFSEPVEIETFDSGASLYESVMRKRYDIVMMDIELTDKGFSLIRNENGMLLADAIKDRHPTTIVIFFSRWQQYQIDLLKHEPFGFIDKPFRESLMIDMVEKSNSETSQERTE